MSKTLPVNPPKISGPTAPITALAILSTMDRAQAVAEGLTVPPPDPKKPLKAWADLSPSAQGPGTIVYNFVVDGKVVKQLMPKAEARSLNLPGAAVYPPYTVTKTDATVGNDYGVDPYDLCTEAEAQAMTAELGSTGYEDYTPVNGMWAFRANGETRRMWYVAFKGDWIPVGQLLKEKNAHGVGAPTTLDLSGPRPVWVPASPTSVGEGVVPVPVRALYPDESIERDSSLMGGGEWIVRLVTTPTTTAPTGTDSTKVDEILTLVREMAKRMGVGE